MNEKVLFLKSIYFKICMTAIGAVLVTGLFMMWTYKPNVEDEISEMSQHYMNDMALSYGSLIDESIHEYGLETAMDYEHLDMFLNGVGLEGMETSYAYLVSPEGTMLYHPTPEKVGEPVENAAVKQTVDAIAAGGGTGHSVIEYEYKGAMKYAGIYVNDNAEYILVVTVDEDEVMAGVADINKRGVIGMVVVLVIGFGVAFLMAMLIVNPVKKISTRLVGLAGMDFTEDPVTGRLVNKGDEIGVMARALETLRMELVEIVGIIRNSSDHLIASAEDLKDHAMNTNETMGQVEHAVGDIAGGATSQAEETFKASENVIQMGEMIEEASNEVARLMQSAEEMEEANQNAQAILQQLIEINAKAEEYIDIIATQTGKTNESAMEIGEATRVISDIAQQTNLLSLNASIEAARAGEQGKGFAVVATEIQKLAEQSTASAKQIEGILAMLLSDSENAVETMREVKDIIHEQSTYMSRTDEAFDRMHAGVEQSLRGMSQISRTTQELDEARVVVVDIVNSLTAIAEENAAATEETSASVLEVANIVTSIAENADSLNDIAGELEEKMNVFTV